MARTITLTKQQMTMIENDANKVEMLTPEELMKLASKLNEHIDIPFIQDEKKEEIILVKSIKQIDRFLYSVLPNEIYELIRNATDGISDADAILMETRLSKLINNYVNIPYLTEEMEQKLFRIALSLIIGAMRKGKSIQTL